MKHIGLLVICAIVLTFAAGCGPSPTPTETPAPTAMPSPTTLPATATEVAPDPCDPRAAPTPTPLPADLPGPGSASFDPDVFPPIDVMHIPPVVLRPDQKAVLDFQFVCGISEEPITQCHPKSTLYAGWGDGPFTPVETMGSFDARAVVPAADEGGGPLRYYIEVLDPQHDVGIRYPAAGCFEPLVVESLVEVHVPTPQPVEPEVALRLPWGQAEGQVGVNLAAMTPAGPSAFDVGPDGTIIVLDNVNSRAIVARPGGSLPSSFPLPDSGYSDIAFDRSWQIAVLDAEGEPLPYGFVHIPQVSLYQFDGTPVAEAPVFAKLPDGFAGSRSVLDGSGGQLVTPFDDLGRALSRDEQRAARRPLELQREYVDESHFRLADMLNGLAFDVTSGDPLGGVMLFERAGEGYVAVFRDTGVFRILRFGRDGTALSFVEIAASGLEWAYVSGFVTSTEDGSVYIMDAAGEAVVILRVSPSGPAASQGP